MLQSTCSRTTHFALFCLFDLISKCDGSTRKFTMNSNRIRYQYISAAYLHMFLLLSSKMQSKSINIFENFHISKFTLFPKLNHKIFEVIDLACLLNLRQFYNDHGQSYIGSL